PANIHAKNSGDACASPLGFLIRLKSCYFFFVLFFFAFFLVAMFLFSLSIFHGCAVLSKKPQLMIV
ncbi:MAG TPA: hypothetical protein VN679_14165, partial [Candidatus Acidoferrales bacterium]|nr:hypothetical protein [Candidatus Acidoferrales bacterium]